MRRRFFLALLGVFILQSFVGALPAPADAHIVIFHINDIHGKIDNLAKVAAIIDAERANGTDVFFFCAGDNFTGNPVIDLYDPPGEPALEILDRLGLDVLSLGNHEFDYGMGPLRIVATRFPTVSANIEAQPGVLPELKPWVILKTKGGIQIAVFGLIQIESDTGLPSAHPDKISGLHFSEPLAKAAEMKKLRTSGQLLIGLTHIGYKQDLLLAKQMPELDLIIGGHSHTRVDPAENVNGVLVAQAGGDNMFLGRVDVQIKDGRVVEKKGRLIDLRQMQAEDETIKAMIVGFNNNPALARIIARAPLEITGKNNLGSLMTDAMRKAHDLDIALHNNGAIRLNRLPLVITLKDVYTLEPFGNEIIQIVMTPAEIRSLIKGSFEKDGAIDLQVSGMTYAVHTDGNQNIKEIELSHPDGSPLDEDRTYKVGLTSYVASVYRFVHTDPGRSLHTTVADDLISYLQSGADLSRYRDLQRAFWKKTPDSPGMN
jgi:2',3'-cyclic-nucleotide 2'-phosphodiesterase (5'-nucleotidase family)